MRHPLRRLFGTPPAAPRPHLAVEQWPAVIYAVGDVHGCPVEMRALEAMIVADAVTISGEKWIVYLGDLVDRGPNSACVLDHLIAPAPTGFRRICLVGNHEVMALAFLSNPRAGAEWLRFGGQEFLQSYGLSAAALQAGPTRAWRPAIDRHIPTEHLAFLRALPLTLSVPGYIFVHAGLRAGVPLPEQREDDLLWIRDDFFAAPPLPGLLVVHGHTPATEPVVTPSRIGVDTGAFATGILTAVRLTVDGAPAFLSTTGNAS